ncbi:MAG: hypothetical protein JXQ80_07000 [Bacteroidales bacterium]|nr:hypothetical protein [Bacteroidales bacterium]
MIRKDDCIKLGVISKPHGTKALLLVRLEPNAPNVIKNKEPVFIEIDGLLVPFFMDTFYLNNSETAITGFEGVTSATKAKSFAGAAVYITARHPGKQKKAGINRIPVKGYRVMDARLGYVGLAGSMVGVAANPLLEVEHNGREYLVPLHDDIILAIDDSKGEIHINAPDGLFDL